MRFARTFLVVSLSSTMALSVAARCAEEDDASSGFGVGIEWPLVADHDGWEMKLYQPQVETLTGDRLSARAAFGLKAPGEDQPAFGVAWLRARASIDRSRRTVTLAAPTVTRVQLPGAGKAASDLSSQEAARMLASIDLRLDLDHLLGQLAEAERERASAEGLDTRPPRILFSDQPALLLLVDGEPRSQAIADSAYERIVNTPYMLVREGKEGTYWLLFARRWYTAEAFAGPWRTDASPPAAVERLRPLLQGEAAGAEQTAPEDGELAIVPVTQPAELVVIRGEPRMAPITGTTLLAVDNTTSDIFLDIDAQRYYLLLAGRWYASDRLNDGAWTYVSARKLPAAFALIPPESGVAAVRAHVPGTPEAEDAVMDASLPQTTTVKRGASIVVTFDGPPRWQAIRGTELSYAINTTFDVIQVSGRVYYCCHQGVWYLASSADGPWTVAITVPRAIRDIPADCPVYHVRYVYVYDSDPDYVHVGYYPGYLGWYVQDGCVVYGTGHRYSNWYQDHYYPRPITWGLRANYDRWNCRWIVPAPVVNVHPADCFGVEVSVHHAGWWGPIGFPPLVGVGFGLELREGRGLHRNEGIYRGGAWGGPKYERHDDAFNVYRGPDNRDRTVILEPRLRDGTKFIRPPKSVSVAEPTFSDRDGGVFRRSGDAWRRWDGKEWSDTTKEFSHDDRGRERGVFLDRTLTQDQRGDKRVQESSSHRRSYSTGGGGGGKKAVIDSDGDDGGGKKKR